MSEFFIRRPIVAIVISILMVIIGVITIVGLPVAQFPDIAPPEIRVQAIYPGADAETMEKAVATPMEQQINGVDNMDYMYSLNSTNNSSTTLMVDFDLKTEPNMDLILTQSRQALAIGQLPPEVNQIGIDVKKSLTSPMMLIALYSPKGTHDAKFLSNYGYINVKEPIARSYGVGQVQIYGIGEYAMRLWVKPDQLAKLGITVGEIANAVQTQNTVNPAGQVGGEPSAAGQRFTYAVRAQGRLQTPEEFGEIVIREGGEGGHARDRPDSSGSFCPGHHRGLHFLARLACDSDSNVRGARLSDRHLRCLSVIRFLGQYPFAVRARAGDRLGGGRCHRRGRRHTAPH